MDLLCGIAHCLELWTPQLFEEWKFSPTKLALNTVYSLFILWSKFYEYIETSAAGDAALLGEMKKRCRTWADSVLRYPLEHADDNTFDLSTHDYVVLIAQHCLDTATLLGLR